MCGHCTNKGTWFGRPGGRVWQTLANSMGNFWETLAHRRTEHPRKRVSSNKGAGWLETLGKLWWHRAETRGRYQWDSPGTLAAMAMGLTIKGARSAKGARS